MRGRGKKWRGRWRGRGRRRERDWERKEEMGEGNRELKKEREGELKIGGKEERWRGRQKERIETERGGERYR